MAYKITHVSRAQEIRFPTQAAAEHYADRLGGGLDKWQVREAGAETPGAVSIAEPANRG
ncbi:hypothetical protein [Amycolatopsis methanolica]|uniref:Uncharacterized protein n=1 Tax=Amycolatopsis methanolica 239 TaxID=1068978 RepID=A0A076MQ01_AMYME|nr:hypothetical protein [Amycolatopsis methanolica]AIJ22993.1 hypothetical protein AMETH_2901 [Amycolatopsis methanolica 239]